MSTPCHALVFRDVRETVSLRAVSRALISDLQQFIAADQTELLLSALLRIAEVDSSCKDQGDFVKGIHTCVLSRALVEPEKAKSLSQCVINMLKKVPLEGRLKVTRPEGFAFYGLHPLDYAHAAESLPLQGDSQVVVIGIRSVGSVLADIVWNQLLLRYRGQRKVDVFTVRPIGHPYDRTCDLSPYKETIAAGGQFLIVDEGPGLSGSSFLSVGEALVRLGVKHERITFLCSRQADPARLVTPDGAERWNRFKSHVVPSNHFTPEAGAIPTAPGGWRDGSHFRDSLWPGLWTSMMPATFRSADGRHVFEYHGLGHYGDAVRERINTLADQGFTLPATSAANGFSRTTALYGCRCSKHDISPDIVDRMAEYLAYRTQACALPLDSISTDGLEEVAQFNFHQATGRELGDDFILPLHKPVIADAQMMPRNWFQPFRVNKVFLKLDCGTHGDNHFYPGPVDIAWDVAGAIIEWEMDEADRDHFLSRYDTAAQDDVRARLRHYMIAYAAFRNGYCRMAASAMAHDVAEAQRLARDAARYRSVLEQLAPQALSAKAYE